MPINKETILSVYNDKLTLMKWLRTVEDALKNDTLKNVELLQDGNQIAFKFIFENSEIITDYILVQGAQGPAGNGISSIVYDSITQKLNILYTNGTYQSLGPLFDNTSDVTIQDLNAVSITSESVETDELNVDGETVTGSLYVNAGAQVIDDLYVDGTAQINTNLNVGNKIEAKEIIEKMTGYEFTPSIDDISTGYQYIYAGIAKNGNKLTFVVYLKLTKYTSRGDRPVIGVFKVPEEIYNKLYTTLTFNENTLNACNLEIMKDSDASSATVLCLEFKTANNTITINFGTVTYNALTDNATYIVRIENTLLLSENLAQ